jgi:hypothetical protein
MPTIKIDSFGGVMPKLHPTLLPDGCAVRAHNCRLKSGKLVPLRQPAKVGAARVWLENGLERVSGTKSLHLWRRRSAGAEFLAWPGTVSVARGNIADDALDRIFVSGQTGAGAGGREPCAYISNAGGSFTRHPLTKAPLPAPSVSRANDQPADADNLRYTFLFQTWVDAWGYESGVSAPSDNSGADNPDGDFVYNDGDEITVAEASAPPGAAKRRIYKALAGAESDSIQFIAEQDAAGDGFLALTLRVKDEDAGEVMPSFEPPPDDLDMMTYVPGDFYAGFRSSRPRTLMFSQSGRPSSWPEAYWHDIPEDIAALAAAGNTVYALTSGFPWALSGTSPDAMVQAMIPSPQACVSRSGVCTMENAVFYPSHDGIVMLSPELGSAAKLITEAYWSKREWQALAPETCSMGVYDGALHAWFQPPGSPPAAYIIDPREGAAAVTTHDEPSRALCYDPQDDALYYVREA